MTTNSVRSANAGSRRRILHAIAFALSIVVIWALYRAIKRDGPAALEAWRNATVQWPLVALSTFVGLGGHLIYVYGWKRFLADLKIHVSFWLACRMYFVSNFGRYLPGAKAWQMGIIAMMADENQLPPAVLAGTSLLQGTVGVTIGAILLFATGGAMLDIAPAWFALPIAGLIGVLASPALLHAWPRGKAIIAKRMPSIESLTVSTMWSLVWTTTVSWVAFGVALYVLATGLLPSAGASIAAYTAAWIGPFLGGVLSMMSAGLGVREVLMQRLLEGAGVAGGSAIIVVFVARVWATVLDVVPAAVVFAIRRRKKTPAQ